MPCACHRGGRDIKVRKKGCCIWARERAPPRLGCIMLSFDLETTGLDPRTDLITCAAAYDPDASIQRVFFFAQDDGVGGLSPALQDAEEFMALLDAADRLCAFNGARFDLPFIQHQLGASAGRVLRWRLKLHDVFVACKWGLGITFPLQALLELNGLPGKTGSGAEAVQLARDGRWQQLGDYCLNDTVLTHTVSAMGAILLPKTRGMVFCLAGAFCSAPCI